MLAEALLIAAGIYLLCGMVFAIPFVLVGVGKIDPHAARGSRGFRVLIIPGTMFLWPLLACRWLTGIHEPPEEKNPHRCAARNHGSSRREGALASKSDIRHPKLIKASSPRLLRFAKLMDTHFLFLMSVPTACVFLSAAGSLRADEFESNVDSEWFRGWPPAGVIYSFPSTIRQASHWAQPWSLVVKCALGLVTAQCTLDGLAWQPACGFGQLY
jgi:hypothetical protein